ncbi:uncharacterized protein LOC142067115 isoform X2 [Phalacrocorax aristotelis]|uniref:uncharacterized protein LOC142067115 isoform X2 n=1 Tax=Phalacrocorax aristotelis TaxID=126867 RepID=UPI003F4BD077
MREARPYPEDHAQCRPDPNPCVEVELVTVPSTSAPCSATQGPAKWRNKATGIARAVLSLAWHPAGALVSLWRHLLSTCVFARQKMGPQSKRFLKVFFLWLPVALAGAYCATSLPVWTTQAKGLIEELTRVSSANLKMLWNLPVLAAEETQKTRFLLEEVARLRAQIRSLKEAQEVNQAASKKALGAYVEMSDWALESSGGCFPRKLLAFPRASGPGGHQVASTSPSDCRHCAAHLQRCVSIWDRPQRPQRRRCLWSGCGRRRGNSPWDVHVQRGKRGYSDLPSEERAASQSLSVYQTSCEEQLGKPSVHLHLSSAGSWEDGATGKPQVKPERKKKSNMRKKKKGRKNK